MNNRVRRLLALGACAALLLPLGCGDDDDGNGGNGAPTGLDVPQEWQGVWENTVTTTDCETASGTVFRETTVDTVLVCPDAIDVFDDEEFGALSEICTETIDGNTYRIVCQGTETFFDECGASIEADVSAVFSPTGDSYTFEGRYEVVASPECNGVVESLCQEVSGTAVRISTSTEDCDPDPADTSTVDVTVTGSSGVPSISFDDAEISLAIAPEGSGWTLVATNVPADVTNYQSLTVVVPPDVEPGAGWRVGTPVTDNDIDIQFVDVRQGVAWRLVDFDGLANISTRSDTRLTGLFSGGGTLADPDGQTTESIDLDVTFDVTTNDPFDRGQFLQDALRAMVRREAARRR